MAQNLDSETYSFNLPYGIYTLSITDLLQAFVVASDEGAKETTTLEVADLLSEKKKIVNADKISKLPPKSHDLSYLSITPPEQASRNLPFLIESHLIVLTEPGKYKPTDGTVRFARTLNWDENDAKRILRQTIGKTWYTNVIAQTFNSKPVMTSQDLWIAFESVIPKFDIDTHRYQLSTLLDILEYLNFFVKINQDEVASNVALELFEQFKIAESPSTKPSDIIINYSSQEAKNNLISVGITINLTNWDDLTEVNALRLHEWLKLVTYGKS
ncbi:MAG: hypothetical protein KIH69_010055 [Anaerolineae bacterium]|nr:hypothetical protein [Anaerolineae bacterium]